MDDKTKRQEADLFLSRYRYIEDKANELIQSIYEIRAIRYDRETTTNNTSSYDSILNSKIETINKMNDELKTIYTLICEINGDCQKLYCRFLLIDCYCRGKTLKQYAEAMHLSYSHVRNVIKPKALLYFHNVIESHGLLNESWYFIKEAK